MFHALFGKVRNISHNYRKPGSQGADMLIDTYGRTVDYLRVSVLENCNFRCIYCMPHTPLEWMPKEDLLSIEELFSFIRMAIDQGIRKIRITGGEPTLREDLGELLEKIHHYNSKVELTLTTNGFLMAKKAKEYANAGLKRVNISLDTLDRGLFKLLTRRDALPDVLDGIHAVLEAGMKAKINMVPLLGFNDHEMADLLKFCQSLGVPLRYIEYMENQYAGQVVRGLRSQQILDGISERYGFQKVEQEMFGPATLYELDSGYRFGIIEPHRDDFCKQCNRIRLTSDGRLVPCLYYDESISIKEALKKNDMHTAESKLLQAVREKPEKNRWDHEMSKEDISARAFFQTGG